MPKRKPDFSAQVLPSVKTDRVRPMVPCWGSNDKENVMKRSNIIDKITFTDKQEKFKEENLDIYCMPLEEGERLLAGYLD